MVGFEYFVFVNLTWFVFQVKRVLKPGGKFVCLTLAESHVLGLVSSFTQFSFNCRLYMRNMFVWQI